MRHQRVDGHLDPDLCCATFFWGAEKDLDMKMLLDSLEEQLDLPAQPVELCNRVCGYTSL